MEAGGHKSDCEVRDALQQRRHGTIPGEVKVSTCVGQGFEILCGLVETKNAQVGSTLGAPMAVGRQGKAKRAPPKPPASPKSIRRDS